MIFNSLEFLIFFLLVFVIYWFLLKNQVQLQNAFLLLGSYVFYGWWDWRFLSLIIVSSVVDYSVGHWLGRTDDTRKRKLLLTTSIVTNIGILGFFKYFDFFAESLSSAASGLGSSLGAVTLNI